MAYKKAKFGDYRERRSFSKTKNVLELNDLLEIQKKSYNLFLTEGIKEIFEDSCLPNEDYGSVVVIKKGIRFDITTFRKEIGYINNRKPSEIHYIDDLYQDLLRRDFSINAMYYFSVEQKTKKELDYVKESPKILSEQDLLKVLKTQ